LKLVQALRLHLAEGLKGGVGWLFALADKQMSAAINAMHEDTAHRWTLQELAERAGMSRSTFALKFKETVGASPVEHLTRWRMLLARRQARELRRSHFRDRPVARLRIRKRLQHSLQEGQGCSPRQYSHGRNPASPSHNEGEAACANRLEPIPG
jgi:AraC-like DNA-binding protein